MIPILLLLVTVVTGFPVEEPRWFYHEAVGIRLAERIRNAEQAADFDGARIVGGSPAQLGAYPYLGGLVVSLRNGHTSVCGSSLLTNNRALTAAHCWFDGSVTALQFTVVLGSVFIFSGGVRINTNDVVIHQNYNHLNLNNDIAMIRMSRVNFNNVIQPINLPTGSLQNENFAGRWAQVAGFGKISDLIGIQTNQFLSHVTGQVISNQECLSVYPAHISNSHICTSGVGGRGPCIADSGGPLSLNTGGRRVLIGVVSFVSMRGCESGSPAAYARVSSYLPWIQARL